MKLPQILSLASFVPIMLRISSIGVTASNHEHETVPWKDTFIYKPLNPEAHQLNHRIVTGGGNATASNGTMGEAERIVREAQEESRARNTYLVNHVRKNKYELKDFSVSKADSAPDPLTATGVNDTVANAAAVVTEFLSLNDTVDRNVVPRQSSTYWMENMVQNGISPFVANATYKVRLISDHHHRMLANI